MNQKRLIITSTISIILVSLLVIGKTYSVFTTTSPSEDLTSYKTGTLDIKVIGDEKTIENIKPLSIDAGNKTEPYRISVLNNGTVPYKFNVILDETTGSSSINHDYIMTKVGILPEVKLSECHNNILKEGIIALPGEQVDIDIRVWISDKVPNTEINKSFFSKLKIEGQAIQNKNTKNDNSSLIANQDTKKEEIEN